MAEAKGVGFRLLTERVDTPTPGGTLVLHIFGTLAQFERDLIRERTSAGLKAAEGTRSQVAEHRTVEAERQRQAQQERAWADERERPRLGRVRSLGLEM